MVMCLTTIVIIAKKDVLIAVKMLLIALLALQQEVAITLRLITLIAV